MRAVYERTRPYLPAVLFLAGFTWDALTLGRQIKPIDLVMVSVYLAGAAAILVLIGRRVTFRGSQYLNAAMQFLFGGIFSALFILYFKSSSDLPGYLVVIGLAVLLVGNEFLQSRYSELTISWAFFTLCAAMFCNFAFAHLFRSISIFWFYIGTLLGLVMVLGIRRVSTKEDASILPSFLVAVVMMVLHAINAIPPVPLVQKEMLVAHDVRRTPSGYAAVIESPAWRFWRTSAVAFHRAPGERLYCFTAVFIPKGIVTTISHRWEYFDEARDEWIAAGTVPIRIAGGREGGYRGYSYKTNPRAGRWRVIAAAPSGASIGVLDIRVADGKRVRPRNVKL